MPAATAWSTRPVPTAMSPEQLAAFVDRSLSRTEGLLFTATPVEELDAIGRWQQLKDQAFAGQMREIVAAYNRASSQEREFAADEVGLAVGATSTTGSNLVAQALALGELPGLLEAVEAGQLTERHALAVLGELDKVQLTLEQRQCVVLVLLARFSGQAPGELRRLVARLIVQVDRAAAAARDAKATKGRRIWLSGDVDGQATLLARGPAAAIAAIRASLDATLPDQAEPGDERSRQAREFDLFVDLLTGGARAGTWTAEVLVPVSVAEGGEVELAEIPGLGPILPATARDLLDQCGTLSQTSVDADGQVVAVSDPIRLPAAVAEPADAIAPGDAAEPVEAVESVEAAEAVEVSPAPAPLHDPIRAALRAMRAAPAAPRALSYRSYRPPTRLRRFVEARDRTCMFPGCGRPARKTDKDHRRPWPHGPTSADNLDCLCRHHHRAKHAVFTVLRDSDGSYVWITRGGWEFRRHPEGF